VTQEHGPFHIDYDVTIDGEPTVNARELHKFLEVGKDFTTWIKGMIEKYGFSDGSDYVKLAPQNGGVSHGGHNKKEYFITFDMGKELSMVSKTPKGNEARKFFIESDKRRRELEAASLVAKKGRRISPATQTFFSDLLAMLLRALPYAASRSGC
jgi:phage anti-repressor protein